jgi:hypothetical protein
VTNEERRDVEPLPDFSTLNDDDLRTMIHELEKEEDEISFRRRVLHGRIDILRAELVAGGGQARRRRAAERDPRRQSGSEGQ